MSTQTVTVGIPTMMQVLGYILQYQYATQAEADVLCQSSTQLSAITANVTNFAVQYAQGNVTVNIVVAFPANCTGTLDTVSFRLLALYNNLVGYGVDVFLILSGLNVSITAGNTYSVYIIETLTEPTTAQMQT